MNPATTTADPAQTTRVEKFITDVKQKIWSRRPILGEIMQKHGDKILLEYAKDFLDVNPSPLLDARKPELIDAARILVEQRLGADVAKGVAEQLKKLPLVSTADHHAPIDHPFWVNANLISALPSIARGDDVKYLVVFSFASVSLNNQSGYPRGIQFYGGVNGSKNVLRVPIMPDKEKMGIVYGMRPYTKEELERTKQLIKERSKAGEITPERVEGLSKVLDEYFAAPRVLESSHLASQITKVNFAMWPKLFHAAEGGEPAVLKVPDLLYLEIETLVRKLLVEKHLNNPSSLLFRALFDPAFRTHVLQHFNNVPGAFSIEKDWGTYFFWFIDDKHHRVRMYLHPDNTLRSKEQKHIVPFSPEGIAKALQEKQIFPSMLLCYLMVSLYYGMKCLGGFCQVNDLTMTKQAWANILRAVGENEEADALTPVQTKELGGDGMVLSYIRTVMGDLIPSSGIDMLLSDRDTRVEKYLERSKWVTLNEMMNSMLPEMYTVLYPSTEREPQFTSVTPEAILQATRVAEKLDSTWNTPV